MTRDDLRNSKIDERIDLILKKRFTSGQFLSLSADMGIPVFHMERDEKDHEEEVHPVVSDKETPVVESVEKEVERGETLLQVEYPPEKDH